jgi:hypothetical protein
MIELAHSVPGRLRVIVRDRHAAPDVRADVLATAGVTMASLNDITGSLVITYHHHVISGDELWRRLDERFATAARPQVPARVAPRREGNALENGIENGIESLVSAIADACVRYVAERSAAALLAAVI